MSTEKNLQVDEEFRLQIKTFFSRVGEIVENHGQEGRFRAPTVSAKMLLDGIDVSNSDVQSVLFGTYGRLPEVPERADINLLKDDYEIDFRVDWKYQGGDLIGTMSIFRDSWHDEEMGFYPTDVRRFQIVNQILENLRGLI